MKISCTCFQQLRRHLLTELVLNDASYATGELDCCCTCLKGQFKDTWQWLPPVKQEKNADNAITTKPQT